MKNIAKKLFYKLQPYHIPETLSLKLGYIFHTEDVFNEKLFSQLLEFCREYTVLTGKKAICTVMAGTSPKVTSGLSKYNCSDETLASRYKKLSEIATLGYHGHFYLNPDLYKRKETEIRSNNFSLRKLEEQFNRDLNWFKQHKLNHNGIYAGGWWFTNHHLLRMLIVAGFKYDFSFSKSPHFLNQFSHKLMLDNNIKAGESFEIEIKGVGTIYEIQNFIGTHNTPFTEDFARNVLKLFEVKDYEATGVLNSHDYDLHPQYTLEVIRFLSKLANVSFFDAEDLLSGSFKPDYKQTVLKGSFFNKPEKNLIFI